jgi:sulfur-carrier protein
MALVCVHGPLRKLAGGGSEYSVDGENLCTLLREFETEHPALAGWVLDETGSIRRHINVYVNGEIGRADTPVTASDRVEVLPAISGG